MKHKSLIFTQIFMAIGITIIKGKLLVTKVIFAFSKYHSSFKTNYNHNMQIWGFYTSSMISIITIGKLWLCTYYNI